MRVVVAALGGVWWSVARGMAAAHVPSRLPTSRLTIGYATRVDEKVVEACEAGVNVVIWAFAHLERDGAGSPRVRATFDVAGVAATKRRLEARGLAVAHLVAFGGWNGPHPDASLDGETWFETWRRWNAEGTFDGVDWDLEGHDDPTAATTRLSDAVVDLVVDFTRLARARGFVVGMAPAESYLDARGDGTISDRLNHQPLAPWDLDFPYAGRNAYAPILARADFDFVSLQLYEGYSRACYETTRRRTRLSDYVEDVADRLARGFDLRRQDGTLLTVRVPPRTLVFGFANAWADGSKFLRADPSEIALAFSRLRAANLEPRGCMFWVIDEEGTHGVRFADQLRLAFSSPRGERADDTDL